MIRVLVADHQPIVSYGIRMYFENSTDIKIVNTASSAKQLLDYLKKSNTDIVLMSIDLPDTQWNHGSYVRLKRSLAMSVL